MNRQSSVCFCHSDAVLSFSGYTLNVTQIRTGVNFFTGTWMSGYGIPRSRIVWYSSVSPYEPVVSDGYSGITGMDVVL